jgi:hypothetical protein
MAKHLGTQKSIRFSEEELALLNRLAKKHKTIKAAIMAGLSSLDQRNDLTQEEVLRWIKDHTR